MILARSLFSSCPTFSGSCLRSCSNDTRSNPLCVMASCRYHIHDDAAHKYSLLGIGLFIMANINSYLAGSVVMARIEYGVKLPNLYATKTHNKNATDFNIIQRSHQNFVEQYAQIVMSVLFTSIIVDRPNVAGMMLVVISISRILYALGYSRDIKSRTVGILLSMFTSSVGVGYGALVGMTALGINVFAEK
mmetsp:Transcript_2577/g.5459  ORF Transcript_2577/g.5459 Transcript_2577/m.5459 type:complete len:191 (-) Transcript_2577:122-694(-)